MVDGPRMQISITILSQTGGHGDKWHVCGAHMPGMMDPHPGKPTNVVDGPDEMRRKVRELVRAGADVIKVCTSGGVLSLRNDPQHAHFMADELDVLVAEATAAGRFVMAHAQATDGIKNAIRAGIRSIEHGIYLDDEAIQMMLDTGTYLVPTLIAPLGVLDAADQGIDMPPVIVEKGAQRRRRTPRIDPPRDRGRRDHRDGDGLRCDAPRQQPARAAADARAGDDGLGGARVDHPDRVGADGSGVDSDLGTIEVGKIADLVAFSGTDLDVITAQAEHPITAPAAHQPSTVGDRAMSQQRASPGRTTSPTVELGSASATVRCIALRRNGAVHGHRSAMF